MMKRFGLTRLSLGVVACLVLAAGWFPSSAQAHVLKSDGQIAAIFHVEPDDSVQAATPTTYLMYLSDESNRLDLQQCNCTITLTNGSQTILSKPVQPLDSLTIQDTITFPAPGVYTLTLQGTPLEADAFQSFSIPFEVRVTGGAASQSSGALSGLLYAGIGLAVGLFLLAVFGREYASKSSKKKES